MSQQFWLKESKMKRLMLVSLTLAVFVCLTALARDAAKPSDDQAKQDSAKAAPQENQEKSASQTKTLTGCLQKGDQPDEFSIRGEDGKSWELRSSTVKLADHVGHQVTVTGSPTREAKAEEKKEGQVEKAAGKEEMGELRITSLKMVSQSCPK
jgi:flagellar biosynthesis/type III secretory pathway M-ring protein FliF/YscJ